MTSYSIEPRMRKYVKGYGFLSFAKNLSNKYGKQLSDTATKIGLDALKIAARKVPHKAAEATDEFIENKIADKIVKPKPLTVENSRNVEKLIISSEKRGQILNELGQVL